MRKALNITVLLFMLTVLAFGLVGCDGNADQAKADEMLGTNVKLNGTWKSEPISYRHDGKDYSGTVELRFNDTQLQIVTPHGISKIHRYTRSGITLTITDAYVPEDNPYRHLPFALEFAGGGFSVDLGGLTFTEGMSNIKLKFTKISDSAAIKEPDSPAGGDLPPNPDEPSGSVRIPTEQEFIESTPGYFVAPTEGLQIADVETIYLVSEAADSFYFNLDFDTVDYIEDSETEEHLVIFDSDSPSIKGTILVKPTTRGLIYDKVPITISGRLLVEDDEYVFDDLSFANFSFTKVLSGNVYLNGVKIEGDSLDFNDITGGYSDHWNYAAKVIEWASFQYMNGDGVYGQLEYSGKYAGYKFNGFIDIVQDGKHIQINVDDKNQISAVAIDGVFYDPDFVWRTQTKIIRCPESVSGEFVVPDGITSIGNYAFNECTGLTSVTIPGGVTKIGNNAFDRCTGLTEATYRGTIEQWYALGYELGYGFDDVDITCKNGKAIFRIEKGTDCDGTEYTSVNGLTPHGKANCAEIVIPEGVTKIGSQAFRDRTGLTSVTIPASVMSIGDEAFQYCNGLTDVTYGGTVEQWYVIGYAMPSTANVNCTDGKAVFRIEKGTDYDGTEYTSVEGLTPYGKTNYTEIAIPNGVTEIEYSAFEYCTGLTSVTIPDSVTSIGSWAFYGCSSLTDIYVNQVESSLLDNAFVPSGCRIHWNDSDPEAPVLPTYDELKKSLPGYMESYEGLCIDADDQTSSLVSTVLNEVNDSMLAPYEGDMAFLGKIGMGPSADSNHGSALYSISGDNVEGLLYAEATTVAGSPLTFVYSGSITDNDNSLVFDDTTLVFTDAGLLEGNLYKNGINLIPDSGITGMNFPNETTFMLPEEEIKGSVTYHLYVNTYTTKDDLTVSSYEEGTYSDYIARIFVDTIKDGNRVLLVYSTTNEPTRTRYWTTGSVLETVCINGTYYDPETVVVGI